MVGGEGGAAFGGGDGVYAGCEVGKELSESRGSGCGRRAREKGCKSQE